MKVKLIKDVGYYRLYVDDNQINYQYQHTSPQKPIVLAKLSCCMPDKFWLLEDIRLCNQVLPNSYSIRSSIEEYGPKNKEDSDKLKSYLHTYTEEDNKIKWLTFSGIAAHSEEDSPIIIMDDLYNRSVKWSFNHGMEKLKEIRKFWEDYEGRIEDVQLLNNPLKQIASYEYYLNLPSLKSNDK